MSKQMGERTGKESQGSGRVRCPCSAKVSEGKSKRGGKPKSPVNFEAIQDLVSIPAPRRAPFLPPLKDSLSDRSVPPLFSSNLALSPFSRILMCLMFWYPHQYQLAKGLSFWAGERCPTEGSNQTEEFHAHPFCPFAYKLGLFQQRVTFYRSS